MNDDKRLLGKTVKDVITGFSGTVTGVVNYLTGCNQALVTPKVSTDGSAKDPLWFDTSRLAVDENVPAVCLVSATEAAVGFDKAAPIR